LPGWGASTRLARCQMAEAADILAALILQAQESGKYGKIYLAGHDWGGLLAWRAAHVVPSGTLAGLMAISAPHPYSVHMKFGGMLSITSYFHVLLNPLSDWFFGSGNFDNYRKTMENETWWNDDWEQEYEMQWRKTGTTNLACYYRHNFGVNGGVISPINTDAAKEIDPDTHILMVRGEADTFVADKMFKQGIGWLSTKPGRVVQYHQIQRGGHSDIFHDDVCARAGRHDE